MKKQLLALTLCLALTLALLPASVYAELGVDYKVAANISGADIYDGDDFLNAVTDKDLPVTVQARSTGDIEVILPGYTAEYAIDGETVTATLTPELYPAEWDSTKVTTITVDNSTTTLENAARYAMEFNTYNLDTWCVINFAEGVSEVSVDEPIQINAGGRITIDGRRADDGRVKITKSDSFRHWLGAVNVITSDMRMVGLDFHFTLRVPDENEEKYDINDVYILGCAFSDFKEMGIGTCGERGYGGRAYGGLGTTNFTNLVFAGNTFNAVKLFSFAGAGDEDYNVIDGYTVCGNTFIDAGVGLLAGDAHTWYVYGYDEEDEPAYCEYNKFQNVLISGNSFTMTEDAQYEYMGIIGVGCANLGNSHNLLENVEIRNNTSRITGGTKNIFSSVSVNNVGVSDNYSEEGAANMGGYAPHMTDGLTHTDYNITRNVRVHDNDFQVGAGSPVSIDNIGVGVGKQCGKGNVMEDIEFDHNTIESQSGVKITNYTGNHLSAECSGNDMRNIRFHHNTVTRSAQSFFEAGILVAGSYISNHGQAAADYPAYSGTMSGITLSGNTVEGYKYGVVAAGSAGDYGVGMGVSDVTVSGNAITTALYNEYPEHDFGVVVAGSCLQTNGQFGDQYSPLQPSNTSCFVRNVSVEDNEITAQGGVAVTGNLINSVGLGNPTGNYVSGLSITGNTMTRREETTAQPVTLPAILAASALDPWSKVALAAQAASNGIDEAEYFAGCFTENVTAQDNNESGFAASDLILGGGKPAPEGWEDIGGLYLANRERLGFQIDNAYYLPMPAGLTHITVKRTGLEGCETAVAALYGENGKMLELAMGGVWANDALTLALPRAAAASCKVFFLTEDCAPAAVPMPLEP